MNPTITISSPGYISQTITLIAATAVVLAAAGQLPIGQQPIGQSSAPAAFGSFPVLPPLLPNGVINARFDPAQVVQRLSSGEGAPWPKGKPWVAQWDITEEMSTAGIFLATLMHSDAGTERANRIVTVSRTPEDFSRDAQWMSTQPGNAETANVSIGADPRPVHVRLSPGTWYVSVLNMDTDGNFIIERKYGQS